MSPRKELTGGMNALVMSLPGTIAFGTVVFAPLGLDMAAAGILTCFIGAFIGGLLATLLGVSKVMITGPRSFAVVILAGLAAFSYETLSPEMGSVNATTSAILAVLVASCLSGLVQVLIGVLKLGDVIKLIPFPIVSGLMNLSALVVILTQVWPMMGIPSRPDDLLAFSWVNAIQPLAVFIGVVTIVVMAVAKRYLTKVPPILFAALAGISLFYWLEALGFSSQLGQRLPAIEFDIGAIRERLAFLDVRMANIFVPMIGPIILSAVSLATLNSLSTLVTGLAIQQLTYEKLSPSRELIGHGAANMFASLFGGVASTGKTGNTQANVHAGARGRLSSSSTALGYGLILLGLTPLLTYLPRPVIAGIAIYLSVGLFDTFGKDLLMSLVRWQKKKILDNVGNILIVTTVLLVGLLQDMMFAIGAALCVTVFEFFYKSADAAIRQVFTGRQRRSRVERSDKALTLLNETADKILVLQLQGSIFFVVAERLSENIAQYAKQGTDFLILDVTKVNYLDQTGVVVLLQLQKQLMPTGKRLLLCGVNGRTDQKHTGNEWEQLVSSLGADAVFQNMDNALEWCEDQIISEHIAPSALSLEFDQSALTQGLSTEQIAQLKSYFVATEYQPGDCVFEEGSTGASLYLIASGTLDVLAHQGQSKQKHVPVRLQTVTHGSLLGEMSLIDALPRSATVTCRNAARCYVLGKDNYQALATQHPALALAVMSNIAIIASHRLRAANLTINHLSTTDG